MRVFAAGTGLHEPGNVTPAKSNHSSPAVFPAPGMESKGESQLQLAPSPLHVLEDRDHPPGCICLAGEGTEPMGRYRCRAPHPCSAPSRAPSTLSAPAGALQGSPSSVLASSPHPERHPVSHTGALGALGTDGGTERHGMAGSSARRLVQGPGQARPPGAACTGPVLASGDPQGDSSRERGFKSRFGYKRGSE